MRHHVTIFTGFCLSSRPRSLSDCLQLQWIVHTSHKQGGWLFVGNSFVTNKNVSVFSSCEMHNSILTYYIQDAKKSFSVVTSLVPAYRHHALILNHSSVFHLFSFLKNENRAKRCSLPSQWFVMKVFTNSLIKCHEGVHQFINKVSWRCSPIH